MPQPQPTFLEVDARKRVSLGKLAAHRWYLAAVDDDGTITLTPAVVMPAVPADRSTHGTNWHVA
jgi:hypothetical protein